MPPLLNVVGSSFLLLRRNIITIIMMTTTTIIAIIMNNIDVDNLDVEDPVPPDGSRVEQGTLWGTPLASGLKQLTFPPHCWERLIFPSVDSTEVTEILDISHVQPAPPVQDAQAWLKLIFPAVEFCNNSIFTLSMTQMAWPHSCMAGGLEARIIGFTADCNVACRIAYLLNTKSSSISVILSIS